MPPTTFTTHGLLLVCYLLLPAHDVLLAQETDTTTPGALNVEQIAAKTRKSLILETFFQQAQMKGSTAHQVLTSR